jgi:hypothetical protein
LRTLLQLSHELKKNPQWTIKKTCHVRCSCTSNRDRPRCVDDQIKINNQSVENVITPALMQSKQCQWIYYKDTRHQSLSPCNTCKMSSKAFSNLGPLETVLDNQVHQLYWKVMMHIPRKDWTLDNHSPSHCASLATQGRVKISQSKVPIAASIATNSMKLQQKIEFLSNWPQVPHVSEDLLSSRSSEEML